MYLSLNKYGKRREYSLETFMTFFELEKPFDSVDRNQLWQILNRSVTLYLLTEVIESLYKNTSVQTDTGKVTFLKIIYSSRSTTRV